MLNIHCLGPPRSRGGLIYIIIQLINSYRLLRPFTGGGPLSVLSKSRPWPRDCSLIPWNSRH